MTFNTTPDDVLVFDNTVDQNDLADNGNYYNWLDYEPTEYDCWDGDDSFTQ